MVQTMEELKKAESKLTDLKYLKSTIHISQQLILPTIQKKISKLKAQIEKECCAEDPNAFWHRKKYCVEFPYKTEYTGNPCKIKTIPMNKEYRELCEKRNEESIE